MQLFHGEGLQLVGGPVTQQAHDTVLNLQILIMSVAYLNYNKFFLEIHIWGIFNLFFRTISTLIHLPPLRFHCADGGGCWDGIQDRCNWCIGSWTL
jgi:hypothetical protein